METAEQASILVIGDKGLLGQELMAILPDMVPVFGMDKNECDIVNPSQVKSALDYVRPRWLINAAAYTDVDGCESRRELAWQVNATGAGNLARACRERGISMIQLSTDFIFDGRKKEPYREDDSPGPLSVYGKSKLAGEEEVRRRAGSYLIIRTSWLFGRGGKNFPDTILRTARSSDSVSVVADQFGSPTSALDLARAIKVLIGQEASGIFHVTNKGSCSWYEYAIFVIEAAGLATEVKPVSSQELNRPAPRPVYSVLSTRRYEDTTGQNLRPWQEAVREYINNQLAG